jgi:hypothetical protein
MASASPDPDQLLERVQAAKAQFEAAIAVEIELFDKRFDGGTFDALAASFHRWMAQNEKVLDALKEYDAATTEYLAAIARRR